MKTTPLFFGDADGLQDFGRGNVDIRKVRHHSKIDPVFGHQLKVRRVALGMTQIEFANILQIHQVTLSRLETGTAPITRAMQERIEELLRSLES